MTAIMPPPHPPFAHLKSRQSRCSLLQMNDFPVMWDLVVRTGLWDRQGSNIASRYKEMYGMELFLRYKQCLWTETAAICRDFMRSGGD